MLYKIYLWLVYSSENADKISGTIKNLGKFIPMAVLLFSFLHMHFTEGTFQDALDITGVFVSSLGAFVTAVLAVIAFIKKIWSTVRGTNQVVLGFRKNY